MYYALLLTQLIPSVDRQMTRLSELLRMCHQTFNNLLESIFVAQSALQLLLPVLEDLLGRDPQSLQVADVFRQFVVCEIEQSCFRRRT